MLDGMCVKTIVFSKPMCSATRGPANCDAALSKPRPEERARLRQQQAEATSAR
jgi:hypothetical protein